MTFADGPASFNVEANRRGTVAISVDPLYRLDAGTIRDKIRKIYDQILEQTRLNTHKFVWDTIRSVDELGRMRMDAMQAFLEDYDLGKRQGRYVAAELPLLAFPDKSFDLAVCSHFLFLYSEHFPEAFHRQAIVELCRVATEVNHRLRARDSGHKAGSGGCEPLSGLRADDGQYGSYASKQSKAAVRDLYDRL